MRESKIGWTDFSGGSANFVIGCTWAGPGCKNCYAHAWANRYGKDFSVKTYLAKLGAMSRAKLPVFSPKRGAPYKPMVFVCDLGDLFHEDVPTEFIVSAFHAMGQRPGAVFQVLTKRANRMRDVVTNAVGHVYPNIWLGVSASTQKMAERRIPALLKTPAAVRFVSVEPMLGAMDLRDYLYDCRHDCGGDLNGLCGIDLPCKDYQPYPLDWVICGAESGPNRRLFDKAWALDLFEQCDCANVPFFFKQGSALRPGQDAVLPHWGEVQEWPGEE